MVSLFREFLWKGFKKHDSLECLVAEALIKDLIRAGGVHLRGVI